MALWDYKDKENLSLRIINAKTGEDKVKYKLTPPENVLNSIKKIVPNGLLWHDEKHFCYLTSNSNVQIYDLETNTEETVFTDDDGKTISGRAASISMLTDGNVLNAILCEVKNTDYYNSEHELRYRIGNGDIITIAAPDDRYFCLKSGLSYKGIIKTGGSGLILTALTRDREKSDGLFIYDTKHGEPVVFDMDETFKPEDIIILIGDKKPRFLTITDDKSSYGSLMKIYDASLGKEISSINLDEIRDEIVSVHFLNEDNAVAIWTKSRMISIYDIETGKLVKKVAFEGLEINENAALYLGKEEDPERDRVFLYTYDGGYSGMNAMALSTTTWEKKADFCGFTAFCPDTNEIYKFKNDEKDEIIKGKAYTLDDLIEKAKNY